MKVLLAGGNSALAQVLRPVLASFADVLTAGRQGCDVALDLAWPAERFVLPSGLDTVVHLAAHFGGTDFDSLLAAEDVNVLGTLKLAHACQQAGVGHLVLISSIFAGLAEESPFFGSYALSKRHGEEVARLYCRGAGLPLTILRPARIYGDGDGFRRHQPFLYALLDRARRGEDIVLAGEGVARRNFIHAEDVAAAVAGVVRQRVEGRYDVAGLSHVTFSEIAAAAVAACGGTSRVRFDAARPDVPDDAFVADDALYRRIDCYPRIALAQGLARAAAGLGGVP